MPAHSELRITPYVLLIAYGNPLRCDDGVGLRLAERMAGRWQATGTRLRFRFEKAPDQRA